MHGAILPLILLSSVDAVAPLFAWPICNRTEDIKPEKDSKNGDNCNFLIFPIARKPCKQRAVSDNQEEGNKSMNEHHNPDNFEITHIIIPKKVVITVKNDC